MFFIHYSFGEGFESQVSLVVFSLYDTTLLTDSVHLEAARGTDYFPRAFPRLAEVLHRLDD